MQAVVTVIGAPLMPEPAAEKGFKIERLYYTLDGKPADPTKAKQNERFAVVLKITEPQPQFGRIIVADYLPAGFEIDNPQLVSSGDTGTLSGSRTPRSRCTPSSATTASARRSTARASDPPVFTVAYVVRAVSPGRYVLPQAYVEDMYRPDRFGRTGTGTVEITAREMTQRRGTLNSPAGRAARAWGRSASGDGSSPRRPPSAARCDAAVAGAWSPRSSRTATVLSRRLRGSRRSGRAARRGAAFSTLVVDRDGQLLRPYATPDGRWRLPATREDVDPRFLDLLLAYEDKRFRAHHGVDPLALARAACQFVAHGRIVSGALDPHHAGRAPARAAHRAHASLAKLRQIVRAHRARAHAQQGRDPRALSRASRPMAAISKACARRRSPISARSRAG